MKTRMVVVTVVVGASLLGWLGWLMNPPMADDAPKPTKVKVATLAPAKLAVAAPVQAPVKMQVEKPTVAAAPVSAQGAMATGLENDPQAQADLNACISQTISLLQAHNVVGLIKTVMPAEELKKEMAQLHVTTVEDFAAQWSATKPNMEQKMAELLQMLQSIQGQTPEMSSDGNEADYPTATANMGGKKGLTFVKVNGFWCLR